MSLTTFHLSPTGRILNVGEQERHHPERGSRPVSGHPSRISQLTRRYLALCPTPSKRVTKTLTGNAEPPIFVGTIPDHHAIDEKPRRASRPPAGRGGRKVDAAATGRDDVDAHPARAGRSGGQPTRPVVITMVPLHPARVPVPVTIAPASDWHSHSATS